MNNKPGLAQTGGLMAAASATRPSNSASSRYEPPMVRSTLWNGASRPPANPARAKLATTLTVSRADTLMPSMEAIHGSLATACISLPIQVRWMANSSSTKTIAPAAITKMVNFGMNSSPTCIGPSRPGGGLMDYTSPPQIRRTAPSMHNIRAKVAIST